MFDILFHMHLPAHSLHADFVQMQFAKVHIHVLMKKRMLTPLAPEECTNRCAIQHALTQVRILFSNAEHRAITESRALITNK